MYVVLYSVLIIIIVVVHGRRSCDTSKYSGDVSQSGSLIPVEVDVAERTMEEARTSRDFEMANRRR